MFRNSHLGSSIKHFNQLPEVYMGLGLGFWVEGSQLRASAWMHGTREKQQESS